MIKSGKFVVKEKPNMYRDAHSKAIINNDLGSLNEHKQKIKISEEVDKNSKRIEKFENEIQEIKKMLTYLINKNS